MRGFVRPLFALALIAGLALPWSVPGNRGDIFAFALPSEAQAQSRPRSAWRPVGAARGTGTVICNRSGNAFACFGIRCAKGRGTEFLFLFNRGDYGEQPDATLTVDGRPSWRLKFTEVVKGQELVSPFAASSDGDQLVRALKAGNTLTFDPGGFQHRFTLKKSSREINRVLAQCERTNGSQPLVSQNSQGQPKKVAANAKDLSWRENDTEASYVARIRKAAVPFGGSCKEEQAIIEQLQREIEVSVEGNEVRAGETVSVNWSGNSLKERIPVYLMLATDAPVRFKGKGFYALMPNAIAPFGIDTFKNRTRVIVPLYGNGALKAGVVKIEGLLAGRIRIQMAVVGWQRKCETSIAREAALPDIKVRPATAPEIDLDDRFAGEQPQNYLINASSNRLIDARNDGTWRLLDAQTLVPIYDGTGTEPRFSETGRFVAVMGESHLLVYDAIDGSELYRSKFSSITWDNKDSFVGFAFHSWGAFEALNTLNPSNVLSGGSGARVESGQDIPTYDLENNLATVADGSVANAFRIDLAEVSFSGPGLNWDEELIEFNSSDLSGHLITEFAGAFKNTYANRSVKTNGYMAMQEMNAQQGCDSCKTAFQNFLKRYLQPKKIAHRAIETERTSGVSISQLAARSLEPFEGSSDRTPVVELLETVGVGAQSETSALFKGDVGENAEQAHNQPNVDQRKFGTEIKQRILTDVPASEDYFKNATGEYAVDYAYRYEIGGQKVWLTQLVMLGGSQANFYNSYMKLFFDGMDADFYADEFDNPGSNIGTECYGSLSYCKANIAAYADRYLAIWSADSRGAAVFDGRTKRLIFKRFDLPRGDLLHKISITNDENHILQTNTDGTFYIHRITDQETVVTGRVVDDEVVVWTPDLHFDATAEGAHFVNLRFPGQIGQYTFQQFDSRLRVPGLAEQVLSGSYEPNPVEIGVPPQLSGSVASAGVRISGTVTPRSLGDLRSIRVYQDGVLSDEVLALESGVPVEIDVARLAGARWVSLVAVDEEGLVSLPVGRDLGAKPDDLAQVRLLAVGVDQYDDEDIFDLNFAKSDASRLLDSVRQQSGKSVELVSSTFLSDADASPQAILAAAEELVANSKPGEQLVFFFAGHGTPGEDGRYYLATSNTDLDNISGTALSWDTLSATLRKSRARMTVFIDSCHSGSAGTDFFASNDDAVSGILKDLPSGLTVFAASKGREESLEDPAIGGGFFTAAVSNVIAGDRTDYDLNQNGVIEVSELYRGVKRLVTKQTAGRQTPWLARNQMVGDFTLF